MKVVLWSLFSVFVVASIGTHIWTTIIAYQESGIGAMLLTFILPGLSEIYWMLKMFETNAVYSTVSAIQLVLSVFFVLTKNENDVTSNASIDKDANTSTDKDPRKVIQSNISLTYQSISKIKVGRITRKHEDLSNYCMLLQETTGCSIWVTGQNIIINWGDTNESLFPVDEDICSHNYSTNGDYTISITAENFSLLYCGYSVLAELNVSNNPSLEELYCQNARLTNLDIANNFALTTLSCYGNQLTQLNVSKNTNLTLLACGSNQLAQLDVSKNFGLLWLNCFNNRLTNLDVSGNIILDQLICSDNQLSQLIVSKNEILTELDCCGNQLRQLDVSKNWRLQVLNCSSNKLAHLDISENLSLIYLSCKNNYLAFLNTSLNSRLKYLNCKHNQIALLDISEESSIEELDCSDNQILEAALNNIFAMLPRTFQGEISCKHNPGYATCNRLIAEDNGWSVE